MSFSERLRAWLRGDTKRGSPRGSSTASRAATAELEAFVRDRRGVEAYLEPKTAIYSTTVLLVADDGEYLRRPVKDRAHASEFCLRVNIPLYDAAKVGYPRRMRNYDRGVRPRRVELSELPPWPDDDTTVQDQPDEDGPPPPPSAAS